MCLTAFFAEVAKEGKKELSLGQECLPSSYMTLQLHAPFHCGWYNFTCLAPNLECYILSLCREASFYEITDFFTNSLLIFVLIYNGLLCCRLYLIHVLLDRQKQWIPCWGKWETKELDGIRAHRHTEQGAPHPRKSWKWNWVSWHDRLCWSCGLHGWESLGGGRARCILGSPPAIVSLSSTLGVHKSFYHREEQYIFAFGFSFPTVSTQYNGSDTATGIDPVFDPDKWVQSFFLTEHYHGNNWCGLAELYLFLWRLNNTFIKVKIHFI